MSEPEWLELERGEAPLVLSLPHTGTEIPPEIAGNFVSAERAQLDADWWLEKLYDFAPALGATVVRTRISRSAIDVNRDPSGASLYPGQTTTGLCPLETFDGAPLYRPGTEPDEAEIARRRISYFEPYHACLQAEIARLRQRHARIVLYDGHSIRSRIPRLFDGLLPQVNIGTKSGAACAPEVPEAIEAIVAETGFSQVRDGRFKGGWITRAYGAPAEGIHAVQIELACRGYMDEPLPFVEKAWPAPYDPSRAAAMRQLLERILARLIAWI